MSFPLVDIYEKVAFLRFPYWLSDDDDIWYYLWEKRGKSAAFVNGEKCHLERIGGGSRGLA